MYCRVSSERQKREGHGLESQEQRCLKKAEELKLEVAEIFPDGAVSGRLFERPAMNNLMAYLDSHPEERFVIIFDDMKRFARDTLVHFQLKAELVLRRKARLECLNFRFEDTPAGRFVETVMAGAAQLEREQNNEQVRNRMKSRLESGEWPFCPPPALRNKKNEKGEIVEYLCNVEPLAGIYKLAIERFANYELETKEAVRKFILEQYAMHNIQRKLSNNGIHRILTELLYTGCTEYLPWGVIRKEGKHKGFITLETHLTVLRRLEELAKPRLRTDYNEDYPLRNFLLCSVCKKPVTASWHRGKMGVRYPHYWCKQNGCPKQYKSVMREKVETEFGELLNSATPQPEIVEIADMVLTELWKQRQELEVGQQKLVMRDADRLQIQAETYKSRIANAKSELAVEEYEKEMVKSLEQRADLLAKNKYKSKYPDDKFGTAKTVVFEVIKNPLTVWEKGDFADKRLLLNMYFRHGIVYDKETGFGTQHFPLMQEVLSSQKITKHAEGFLVEMGGVKPPSRAY